MPQESSFTENLVTGSAAGVGIAYSTFPAEALKKYYQTRQTHTFKAYRGSLLFAINIVPTTAIQWGTDGFLRQQLPANPSFAQQVLASAFCGAMGALTATPVENSVVRQQVMQSGALPAVKDMFSQGMLRPWKTYSLVASRDAIFTMWMLSIMPALNAYSKENLNERYYWPVNFAGAAVGAALSHPFDTVGSNIQKNHSTVSAASMAKELYAKEGVSAFYRGFSYRLFLFFAFSNGIPMFKQAADHCIYGRGELPTLFKTAQKILGYGQDNTPTLENITPQPKR